MTIPTPLPTGTITGDALVAAVQAYVADQQTAMDALRTRAAADAATISGQGAALASMTAQRDTALAQATSLAGTVTALQGTVATLQATVATLRKRLAALAPPRRVLWGATGTPTDLEAAAKRPLPVHRTYATGSDVAGMETQVRKSHAAGHGLVIASCKPPADWSAVTQGWCDSVAAVAARCRADGIDARWIVNHEPEGGGAVGGQPDKASGAAGFRQMTTRLVQAFAKVGCADLFGVCLMSWTFRSGSGWQDWLVDGLGFLGVDYYVRGDAVAGADPGYAAWTGYAAQHGIPVLLCEFGFMNMDMSDPKVADMMASWAQDVEAAGLIRAVCYFHTTQNGGQPLTAALRDAYVSLIGTSPTAYVSE